MSTAKDSPRDSTAAGGLTLCTHQTIRITAQTFVNRIYSDPTASQLGSQPPENLLSDQCPSCSHFGVLASRFEVLSSGFPFGAPGFQTLGSWVQCLNVKSQIQNMGSGLEKLSSKPRGLCLLVLAPSRKGSIPLSPSQALCSLSIQGGGQNQVRCWSHI